MTWVGKILAVLVLVLALAWMWFTASVYVARTNWKNDRDAWKKLYEEAKTARTAELDSYRNEKAGLEAELLAMKTANQGLAAQVAKLNGANEATTKANATLNKTISENDIKATELQANLTAAAAEVQTARKRIAELEGERVNLVVKAETAERERQAAANLTRKAETDRQLAEQRLERLSTELAEIKAVGGGTAGGAVTNGFTKPAPALPEGIRGTVTKYEDGYVQLSIGIDAGLSVGSTLDIYRHDDGGKYLGTVTITNVYPKEAVGLFKSAENRPVGRLRPDQLPKAGDTVGKIGGGPITLK